MTASERELLVSAQRLFYERSFDGVGVDDIGRAAGVSGSAIYRHFSGKDEILAALFSEVLDAILIRMGPPDPDPRRDLEGVLRAYVELAAEYGQLAAIWIREQRSLDERFHREHDRRQRRVNDRLVDSLAQCYPHRSRDELVTVARGLQLLLFSESFRPPRGRRAPRAPELLYSMAVASLGALGDPDPEPRNANNSWSKASAASNMG